MNFIPIEKLKMFIGILRVIAFDTRVTFFNSLFLLSGVIIHFIVFFDSMQMRAIPLVDLKIASIAGQIQTSADIPSIILELSAAIQKSPALRSSLEAVHIDIQADFGQNKMNLLPSACTRSVCEIYQQSENKLAKFASFMPPLDIKNPNSIFGSITISGSNFTINAVEELKSLDWLPATLKDGVFFLSMLFKTSFNDPSARKSYLVALELGKAGYLKRKSIKSFEFTTSTSQGTLCILILCLITISMLLYIIKFSAKLNFMFSEIHIVYGILYIGAYTFTLAVAGQHRSIIRKIEAEESSLDISKLAEIFYSYNLYKITLFLISIVQGFEVIKVPIYTRRFKKPRQSALAIFRTFGIITKALLFILIIITVTSFAMLTFDGIVGLNTFGDLFFYYSHWQPSIASYFATVIYSCRGIFDGLVTCVLIAIVFVALSNAENLE